MSNYENDPSDPPVSGLAVGGVIFAATIMIMMGIFQAFTGLFAILDDQFYVVAPHYALNISVSQWGWIHLILGIVVAVAGAGLFSGKLWATIFALILAVLSAISNFLYIPYYPFWSLLIIGLNVWVIWALTRPGMMNRDAM